MSKRYACFIGRWQPWHDGHDWLIRQKLDRGVPVLVCVRPMPPSANNPFSTADVVRRIKERYHDEDVVVHVLPVDIESVNYGRAVGYEVNEWTPPSDVAAISATAIRDTL